MFSPILRALSFVPRWQIAPRVRTTSVAEHSFFVAVYTMELLAHKPDWTEAKKRAALSYALTHDMPEAVTGDMPGPVKRAVTNPRELEAYEERALMGMGFSTAMADNDIRALVKVADLIDDLFYLHGERGLGNRMLGEGLTQVEERLGAAVEAAGLPLTVVQTAVARARAMELVGAPLPRNHHSTDPLTPDRDKDIPIR